MSSTGATARARVRRHHAGMLATLSHRLGGYPFGSTVPFVLDHAARPVILVSRLAEHTRNIEADRRASLLVSEPTADVQAGARLTLVGDVARATGDLAALQARYLRYFPDAERLLDLDDFAFYRLEPLQIRYIAGFADIHWISAAAYAPPANALADHEATLLARANDEHADTLRDCCRFHHGRETERAVMIGIDCDGFDLRAPGSPLPAVLRVDFEHPAVTADEVSAQLRAVAQKVRVR